MKSIIKRLATIGIVFSLTVAMTPISALAGHKSPNGWINDKSSTGAICCVYYKGGKVTKNNFTIGCSYRGEGTLTINGDEYECDIVSVRIAVNTGNRLSNANLIGAYKDAHKWKKNYITDYIPIIIDQQGEHVSGIGISGGFVAKESSKPRRISAKSGRITYYMNSYRPLSVYRYTLKIPKKYGRVYAGLAGLRYGQTTPSSKAEYRAKTSTFYKAGYGSNRAGFTYVLPVN